MEELTAFQKKQVMLIAKYYPFSISEVEEVFILSEKSYDKTISRLRFALEHNVNIEQLKKGTK